MGVKVANDEPLHLAGGVGDGGERESSVVVAQERMKATARATVMWELRDIGRG